MHTPDKRLERELLLDLAESLTKVILQRAERAIDAHMGPQYARKNPALLQRCARILYDEYCDIRNRANLSSNPPTDTL